MVQVYCKQVGKKKSTKKNTHCNMCVHCPSCSSSTLRPDISWKRTIPKAYTSVLTETMPYSAYSGAKYLMDMTRKSWHCQKYRSKRVA